MNSTRCRWIEYISPILTDHYANISLLSFLHLHYNRLSFSSPVTVFMITEIEGAYIGICVEGFLYGMISVLCALTCTLVKEVHILNYWLFPDPGMYSGIFAMYLHWTSENSTGRKQTIFYALWVLYVLSTVSFVSDFVGDLSINVSTNDSTRKNIIF